MHLSRLRGMHGVSDQVITWIKSYLSDRLQRVGSNEVDKQELNFDVPHGVVLGPISYCLYTRPGVQYY